MQPIDANPEITDAINAIRRIAKGTFVPEIGFRVYYSVYQIIVSVKYQDIELSTSFSPIDHTLVPEEVIRQQLICIAARLGEFLFVRPLKD